MTTALGPIAIVTPSAKPSDMDRIRRSLASIPTGLAWVQLRDKSASPEELREAAVALRDITTAAKTQLVINGSVELAISAKADGVHLPEAMGSSEEVQQVRHRRTATGAPLWVGTSRHSSETAHAALVFADYVFLGPIWPTIGKPDGLGPQDLGAGQTPDRPGLGKLFAIGGIQTENRARAAIEHGADGVAGIRAFHGEVLKAIAKVAIGLDLLDD